MGPLLVVELKGGEMVGRRQDQLIPRFHDLSTERIYRSAVLSVVALILVVALVLRRALHRLLLSG